MAATWNKIVLYVLYCLRDVIRPYWTMGSIGLETVKESPAGYFFYLSLEAELNYSHNQWSSLPCDCLQHSLWIWVDRGLRFCLSAGKTSPVVDNKRRRKQDYVWDAQLLADSTRMWSISVISAQVVKRPSSGMGMHKSQFPVMDGNKDYFTEETFQDDSNSQC